MKVEILREAGYEEALLGLSLSFYDHAMPLLNWDNLHRLVEADSGLEGCRMYDNRPYHFNIEADAANTTEYFWTDARFAKAEKIALHLATKTPPEDYETRNNLAYISAEQKFLESIDVWVFIQASRDFWSEFDTYRVDITKQSSSTMHTLSKRFVTEADFEEGTSLQSITALNAAIGMFRDGGDEYHNVSILKKNLPEGWLQERVVKTSYKTLKWIIEQRDGHRLDSWKIFNEAIIDQLEHPEYIKYER